MEYFIGHEIPEFKLERVIGRSIKSGVRGSTTYFIKEISSTTYPDVHKLNGAKGVFQLFDKGILLRMFKSAKTYSIAISYSEIREIHVNEGEHWINPRILSPFWIALKLGVNIHRARYFARFGKEYEKHPTVVQVETGDFSCQLTSSGFSYPSEERFFKSLNTNKVVIKPAAVNVIS